MRNAKRAGNQQSGLGALNVWDSQNLRFPNAPTLAARSGRGG
jgi:hypothetical protein